MLTVREGKRGLLFICSLQHNYVSHVCSKGRSCESFCQLGVLVTIIGFWPLMSSSRVKNVNGHEDQVGRGRNAHNSHRLGLSYLLCASKMATDTQITWVGVAMLVTATVSEI